jgi:DNA replication protein DnaC
MTCCYEQTHEKLIAMKLFGLAAALKDRIERRDHQDLSKTEFLGLLIDDEWLYRENRKLTARLKVAKFKLRAATIESIDYSTPRGLRKDQVLELTQNRWLRAHESLLITGPSGSGKSFVAQAFGQHACRSGFPVQYLRMPALADAVRAGAGARHLRSTHQALRQNRAAHHRRPRSGES